MFSLVYTLVRDYLKCKNLAIQSRLILFRKSGCMLHHKKKYRAYFIKKIICCKIQRVNTIQYFQYKCNKNTCFLLYASFIRIFVQYYNFILCSIVIKNKTQIRLYF